MPLEEYKKDQFYELKKQEPISSIIKSNAVIYKFQNGEKLTVDIKNEEIYILMPSFKKWLKNPVTTQQDRILLNRAKAEIKSVFSM